MKYRYIIIILILVGYSSACKITDKNDNIPITPDMIDPENPPVLEFEVQFDDNLNNSSIIMSMASYATGDAGANPLTTVFHGFGQFAGYFVALDEEVSIPGEFALHPNFPNPFNPSTQISYFVPKESMIDISVYDISGRLIETLVNELKNYGPHSIMWNASSQASGVYFVRIKTDGFTNAQKVILTK